MTGKHPRLRRHVRTRKSGKVVVYYTFDMRPEGKPDVALGSDFAVALERWEALYHGRSSTTGTLEEAFAEWEDKALPLYESAETKRGYTKHLRRIRPVFGGAQWSEVDMRSLTQYLEQRTAKTQANRELALLSVIWNWARTRGLTTLPWPAAGMERSRWKNKERARQVIVHDEVYAAIYAEADQTLRDCMDLASATGLRLTDCLRIALPRGDMLTIEASKTGKSASFDVRLSQVLPDLIARRRAVDALHVMLLSTPQGQRLTYSMLRARWDKAREAAATKAAPELAEAIRSLWLRDMRKRAAQAAGSLDDAAELLQHDSKRLTERHYGAVRKLRPVR